MIIRTIHCICDNCKTVHTESEEVYAWDDPVTNIPKDWTDTDKLLCPKCTQLIATPPSNPPTTPIVTPNPGR